MPASTAKPVTERRQALYGLLRILRRQCDAMAGGADPDLEAMLGIVETLRGRAQKRAVADPVLWSPIALEADAFGGHLRNVIDGAIMRRQMLANECREFARSFEAALAAEAGKATAALQPTARSQADDALLLFRSLRRQMGPTLSQAQGECTLCAG